MNRAAPLDVAFGITLMVAGAMIALPEKLKAKPAADGNAIASETAVAEPLRLCETAKAAALEALRLSDTSGYQLWEQRSRDSCRAAGY